MENRNKTRKIMNNVMAALGTFGIEYDVNEIGGNWIEQEMESLKPEIETVDFDLNCKNFQQKFKDFAEKENYSTMSGSNWADDGGSVVVLLSRIYQMTEEDWDRYASFCGCNDPYEAQAYYGDPTPSYMYMKVRVQKGQISQFVRTVAKYCW